jgi:aspartate dehydrogenase
MGKKVGIIGYGRLGRFLVERIEKEPGLSLAFVHDIDEAKLTDFGPGLAVRNLDEAKQREADLVVEVVNTDWVLRYAPSVLEFSDLLIASVAAFAHEGLKEHLDQVARKCKKRYYIPQGGIVGLDGLRTARDVIDEVRITTTRPPEGFHLRGEVPLIETRKILFQGSARQACREYPKDVNFFAATALNGLGFDRTCALIIADPEAKHLTHTLEVKGPGLLWKIEVSKRSHSLGNIKGGFVPESLFGSIKRICLQDYGMTLL